jgi:hypothetical protein
MRSIEQMDIREHNRIVWDKNVEWGALDEEF